MIRRSHPQGSRLAKKVFLFSLSLVVTLVGLLSGTVLRGRAFGPMLLGNYADTTVQLGANTTITPDAAPTITTGLNVSTSTNFKGRLEGSPTTGVVHVTNAHPAGAYTVTVTAFDGVPTTKTFTLTVTTPASCNAVTFAAAANFAVGDTPTSVAVGDFNSDGKQDFATANFSDVSVLLGDGAGSFSDGPNFVAGSQPTSVAVDDFNGDGKQDLAVANQASDNVSVLLGDGTGGFSVAINFGVGSHPVSVAVGDFNGDGKQDLVVANPFSDNVSVLLGDGAGSFNAATNFGVGSGPFSVAVGDFNGDGKHDFATANKFSNKVSVLLGDGAGGFNAATSFDADSQPISVAVGDFNGDAKQDLGVANQNSSNVSVLLGDGAGGFSAATNFDAAKGPDSVAVGDFNGDAKQDLAVANESNTVSVLLGDGAGSFSEATNFGVGSAPTSVAVGDFDGDGKQDLAVANGVSDSVSVLLRQCPTTFIVTNTNDSGAGSLRQAITDSNSFAGTQTIAFNIPGGGVHTIRPLTELPTITDPVVIDGYTQPGASPNSLASGGNAVVLIELSGINAVANGLNVSAGNTVVRGLVINRFVSTGIQLQTSGGNVIEGNFIGTNASGTVALGSHVNGAVRIFGSPNNLVGGTAAGARNIISGNNNNGVVIQGNSASGNRVQNNYVGTDVNGTADLGNGSIGVSIFGAPNNTIGGTAAEARNVISGNNANGVQIREPAATGNQVQGNFIGTDVSGTTGIGNAGAGVLLANSPLNNTIGGSVSGAGNVIAFNSNTGIVISGNGNAVLSNSVFSNTNLGIDLGFDGVTTNDAGDGDSGPNNLQNFPVLTSVISGSNTIIQGTLNSTANTSFTIQFFSNPACDAPGNGEGHNFLGSTSVTTDAAGNGSFSAGVPTSLTTSQVVTATATDGNTNTSEFSVCTPLTVSSFSISGRIADGSGQPLSGVTVTVSSGGGSTTTDANGNYSFSSLAMGGNYTITPSSNSYSFSPASHTFNDLNVNRIANFVGRQTVVSITGRVTTSANVGISDVTVALTRNGAPAGSVLTDNLGNYSFGSLEAGANYVVTPLGSFTPSSQSFTSLTVNAVANFTAAPNIPPQCNTVSFSRTDFAVGATFAATGDFNNDGKSDLAVANSSSAIVSILLGTGTGSFGTATNFAVGGPHQFIAIGDINNDGNSDLAVPTTVPSGVSILLGTGTGSFGAATNFAVGTSPFSVAIGDFNSDGRSDLATANTGSANVSILLGSGTGSFSAATNFAVGGNPFSVAIGDFDNDGKTDLAVSNSGSNNVSILLGTGTGSFGGATNFAVGNTPRFLAIGDFNRDGKNDLAVANILSDNVSILLGIGAGNFSAANNFATGSGPRSIAIGDFNSDGKTDLAVANRGAGGVPSDTSILLGSGTGSFGAPTNFAVGSGPFSVASNDFNNDRKSDLVVANSDSNSVSVVLNTSAPCNTQSSLTISGRIAGADNSPLQDVAVTLSGPITRVTQTNASGNFAFTNLVPGGNYAVTVQSSQYVFAPSRVDFFTLSGNQTTNFTAVPGVVPPTLPPLTDDFDSPTRDPNKWSLGTLTQSPTAFDPQINVAQIDGHLRITPPAQVSGLHYNGYVSVNSFDMRGGSVNVELAEAATGGAESIFAIGSDADNFYRFMVRTAGPEITPAHTGRERDGIERPLDTTVAQLVFQVNVGGQLTALSIPYDPVQHRHMRFRHDAQANAIVFETSPNNIDFTERHRVTLTRSVSALAAELSAGTSNPTNPGAAMFDNFGLITSTFQFSSASYMVDEGGGSILITVTRSGSMAGSATVDYATTDGTASQNSDYILAAGRLTFAPGEMSKTFRVLIVDNGQAEGNKNLNLLLQEPSASGLNAPGRAVLTIIDNDTIVPTVNRLDDPTFYVQQHYYDFLNREPDAPGLAFWVDQITSCGSDQRCIEIRRINVSAAYFLSIEFQQTGYLVHRFYNLALNRPNGLPRYLEFFRDTQAIGRGVVVGAPGFEVLLEANKVAYAQEFSGRSEFTALYPLTQTAGQYVDALYVHAGITPDAAERQAAIDEFNNPAGARGRVLRRVAENSTLSTREFNRAFVLAQYFGYLRRNPDDAPDNNLDGYNFWLGKLNQFNGNFVNAEMVKAFITSGEYRQRFGP